MIKWFKSLFTASEEDRKLAQTIRELAKTHDITVTRRGVSITRKRS